MSNTAQKKDIHNKKVIDAFAKHVETQERLDLLYLFTIADMCGTNPTLFNSWRSKLLQDLYQATLQWFQQETPVDFLKHSDLAQIKEEGQKALANGTPLPIIEITPKPQLQGIEVFLVAQDTPYLFAIIAHVFEGLHLSILQAIIYTSQQHICFNRFTVLSEMGLDHKRLAHIQHSLASALRDDNKIVVPFTLQPAKRLSRYLKHFKKNIHIHLNNPSNSVYTCLEITAPDFPGLLATVGKVFVECNILLFKAQITTLGKKVEDTFYICDKHTHKRLEEKARQQELKDQLLQKLLG